MVEGRRGGRRADGRRAGEVRPVRLTPGFLPPAEGSVLIEMGATRVVCTATVQESVPPFLRGQGRGWVTAEYAMLPRSSGERIERERRGPGGRTHEIQRLVGRSLRAVMDMTALGERSILIDCDVIQADGGTRTASIIGGHVLLDLAYAEDSRAEVDLNLVMTGAGRYVEVQGTAEGKPFTERQLERLLAVARAGLGELTALQRATLRAAGVDLTRRG